MKMNYNLRNKTTDGKYAVVLVINDNYQRYRYSTDIKVFPKEWDSKKQIVKMKTTAVALNAKLKQIAEYASRFFD